MESTICKNVFVVCAFGELLCHPSSPAVNGHTQHVTNCQISLSTSRHVTPFVQTSLLYCCQLRENGRNIWIDDVKDFWYINIECVFWLKLSLKVFNIMQFYQTGKTWFVKLQYLNCNFFMSELAQSQNTSHDCRELDSNGTGKIRAWQ